LLAFVAPAMATVTITAVQNDINSVLVNYTVTGADKVRAFALDVTCTDSALVTSKTLRQNLTPPAVHDANYYLTPTTASFNTINGTLRVWNSNSNPYGLPIVQADANGCVIEMASLYATNDPCVAHRFGPPTSGTLVKLYVNQALRGSDNQITVSVTGANAKRGGVVLENGTTAAPVGLPATVVLPFDCMYVGETRGGVYIDSAKLANWITAGKPASWCHPGHFAGDANMDCQITAVDLVGPAIPNFKASFAKVYPDPAYAPSCDTNNDLQVTAVDLVGGDPLCPNCGAKANWAQIIHVPGTVCP